MVQSPCFVVLAVGVATVVAVAAGVEGLLIGVIGGGVVTDGELQPASTSSTALERIHDGERESEEPAGEAEPSPLPYPVEGGTSSMVGATALPRPLSLAVVRRASAHAPASTMPAIRAK